MSGRPNTTALEVELWRLLNHARSCDGVKLSEKGKLVACPTCSSIDRRLEDGTAYFADDPLLRLEQIDKGIVAILRQAERLDSALVPVSVPHAIRSTSGQIVEWLGMLRSLIHMPVTEIPGYQRPPRPEAQLEATAAKKRRASLRYQTSKLLKKSSVVVLVKADITE
jgi:hypothetical protein